MLFRSLRVAWSISAARGLGLRWTEVGGPLVRTPERPGVGTVMVERMAHQHGGESSFAWRPDGLVVELFLPLSEIRAD
mgnify:CR=1 FL=1